MPAKPEQHEDWEHLLWFFAAHKHGVYEAHLKGLDELESEIGAINEELHALIKDYIEVYKTRQSLKDKPMTDTKRKVAEREFIRVYDKFKEYITSMSGDE
jgi:hypothetical protein